MKVRTLILAAAAAFTLAAPAAGQLRPDNRAGIRGPASTEPTSVRPDDRAGIRGIGQPAQTNMADALSRYLANNTAAVRPDDRAGIRGIGQPAQADQTDALSRHIAGNTAAVRPDDRAGWHGAGPGLVAPLTATTPTGTSWHDFGLGALIGAAAMLATLAAAYTGRNRIHRPHLPIHSH